MLALTRRFLPILVVAAISASERVEAGDRPAPRKMTLTEALAHAHEHQPAIREARSRILASERDADATRARWYPLLTFAAQLTATTTNNTTGSYLAVAGLDNPRISATRADGPSSASLVPAPSTLVGLGLRQEIYDFGRISAQTTADELRVDLARLSSTAASVVVDYDVEEAYFAVYAAKSVLEASDKAYARAIVHRDLAKAGVETGMRRPIELARAEAVTDRYELERIRARTGVETAQTVLATTIGIIDRRVDIEDTPPSVRDLPAFDGVLAKSFERNPELQAALLRIRVQERTTHAIDAETRPNLLLSAAVSGNAGGATPSSGDVPPGHGLLPAVPNWDVGLVLAWPLFDATVTARAERSRAEEATAREHADAVRLRIATLVESAYLSVASARESLPVLRKSLEAAIANYEHANARFEVGLGNAVELADAEELRVAAEIQLALGTFDVARARAELGRAMAEAL